MTMNVNGLAQIPVRLQPAVQTGSEKRALYSFMDAVQREYAQAVQASAGTRMPDVSAMTMDEYKKYIYDAISSLPLDPSQALSEISVTISEEGFAAMKEDAEYEKWVLDTLRKNFAVHDPWTNVCGGSYQMHFFGAAKEDYRGEGWYPGYAGGKGQEVFDEKSENSFWEMRMKRHKKNMELAEEIYLKHQMLEAQRLRERMFDPDGEKAEYLAGVPAAFLLSAL